MDVRFAPIASEVRHRNELALRAQERTHALQQTTCADCTDLLDHLVGVVERPQFRRTGRYGTLPDHSALTLAARITLPHFSVSSAMSFPKSTGEPTSGVPPRSASRALILGSARAALISLLSFSTISTGVAFGAPRPDQPLAS